MAGPYFEDLKAGIPETLELIAERFQLYPIPGEAPPPQDQTHTYLIEHAAQYNIGAEEGAIAFFAASDAEYTESLPRQMRKMAGALIGVSFTQDELTEMARS
jgi:hypothetical protein